MKNRPVGILLLNMGGPDRLEDIPRFLYNLFSDRGIIRLGPSLLQKPLAWLISRRRAPKSMQIYAKIGGGSPLRAITTAQAGALGKLLENDGEFVVEVAMRYWQPNSEQALTSLYQQDVRQIIALPLYPHYSRATSGSSLTDLKKAHQLMADTIPLITIPSWPDEPHYISALAARIKEKSNDFADEPFQLVYSAHSLPVSFIEDGDPYVDEIKGTISAVEELTGINGRLSYQSRSGPVEWLTPDTSEMLKTLSAKGCKNILMVPISFVSDHVETLYEIDMLFKDEAADLGMKLISTPALNSDPTFIAGLRALVINALGQQS